MRADRPAGQGSTVPRLRLVPTVVGPPCRAPGRRPDAARRDPGADHCDLVLQVDHAFRRWLIATAKLGFGIDDYVARTRRSALVRIGRAHLQAHALHAAQGRDPPRLAQNL